MRFLLPKSGRPALIVLLLTMSGCAVRRTTHIRVTQKPQQSQQATLAELVARVNGQSAAIRTMSATVEMSPATGSISSGLIKQYRDVRGFILFERPQMIRMIGQAPVIRTSIFDMVSDGRQFEIYLPTERKFIVGKTSFRRPAKNPLENLRPQYILDALLATPVDPNTERAFLKEAVEDPHRYYVIGVVELAQQPGGPVLSLSRELWFDRATLELVRVQLYGVNGAYEEDVHYSDYRDFQGVRYPSNIHINRLLEDVRLAITITKATFNQTISPDKFVLKRPEGAQLIELSDAGRLDAPVITEQVNVASSRPELVGPRR